MPVARPPALDVLEPWAARFAAATADLAAPVVVGCSGGADSVALLALAAHAGLAPVGVHVDHGLRDESAREGELVCAIAAQLGTELVTVRIGLAVGPNLEARARTARYAALEAARVQHGATWLLVGHTADDQAETVLLNVLRGAAASGLSGMSSRHEHVARPLLEWRRRDTRAVCNALGIDVVADPMNDDLGFRRVAVRREVLPLLERIAQRDLVPVLTRQADILRSESEFLDELAVATWPGDGPASAGALGAMPVVLARRAVRVWLGAPPPSSAEVARVLDVAAGHVRAAQLAGGRSVHRSAGVLVLTR
jgi:tRNA(Ile)-lysidine synthase